MRKFIRLMLGAKSKYSNECYEGRFIGAGFLPDEDLTDHLYDNWREFNSKYRPVWLEGHPGKSKVAAYINIFVMYGFTFWGLISK